MATCKISVYFSDKLLFEVIVSIKNFTKCNFGHIMFKFLLLFKRLNRTEYCLCAF